MKTCSSVVLPAIIPHVSTHSGHETKSATMAVMRKDRERTMSVMVDSGRGNRLSANFQQKSASVSAIPDSKHPFSPPLSEVCPVNEDTADSIYEMTTAPEDYEFVDPAKARASMLQQDDIYQVNILQYVFSCGLY